jgi:DnaJ-class molecular chaperone
MSKDYYKTLGVDKTASDADIKSAFRKLAHEHHPDKNGGDDKKFKEINEAYQTLSDKNKRAQYDQFGSDGPQFGGGGGNPFGQGGFGGFNWEDIMRQAQQQGGGNMHFDFGGQEFDLGDLFGAFGGGGFGGRRVRRGRNVETEVKITFKESITGTSKEIEIPVYKDGKKESTKKITIDIPPGIDHGQALQMSGAGETITDGQPGNLIIQVRVEKHKTFRREGQHLVMEMDVSLTDALLGKTIDIETLDGTEQVKIPECMPVGTILKIPGKGVRGGGYRGNGDILIVTHIKMPKKLGKDARKLVEELGKEI